MKILQLCKKFPFPAKDGESIAILQLGKALYDAGCEVSLLAMNTTKHFVEFNGNIPEEIQYYKDIYSIEVDNRISYKDAFLNLFSEDSYHISRFISEAYRDKLVQLLQEKQFDIIQLETLYLAPFIEQIKSFSDALIVLRAHNIEHEIWSRISNQITFLPKKLYLKYLSEKLKKFETRKLNEYDFLVAITERDLNHFKSLGYKNGCMASPVGIQLNEYLPDYAAFTKPLALSFIGSLDWMPNSESLKWFLHDVWPSMHRKFPDLGFHFAGRNAPPYFSQLNLEKVFYHPEVRNAKEFLLQYPVLVVPVMAGSGIRVKILEAMALGRVVITTSIGLEGIPAHHMKEVIIANSVEDFISSVEYCDKNYDRIMQIGRNAREFVFQHFNSTALGLQLANTYRALLETHTTSE